MQLEMVLNGWGGRRAGAGRKRDPKARDPMHVVRPVHVARHPLHVVIRTLPDVPRLRSAEMLHAIRRGIANTRGAIEGFRVCHLSIQHNHVHFVIEARDGEARTRGMLSLTVALANAINREADRHGKVFAYRYHATAITTPRQMRNTLSYVLNNWRHHREDLQSAAARAATYDWYATASRCDHWSSSKKVVCAGFAVSPPQTWLLATGWWKMHGPIAPT
jgi:REP element-mobilizing transposase RayT